MIYTTNWIERLQKDFRRVTRMRGAMPNEESVLLLMGKTAMDKKSYLRQVPRIDLDETLFPPEKAAPQPEYTTSGCYRSNAAGDSSKRLSSRLTVALPSPQMSK